MAEQLGQAGVAVGLVVTVDPITPSAAPGNVKRLENFYISDGVGKTVQRGPDFHGSLQNIDLKSDASVGHVSIANSEHVHQQVLRFVAAGGNQSVQIKPDSPGWAPFPGRLDREERMMVDRLDDRYRDYAKHIATYRRMASLAEKEPGRRQDRRVCVIGAGPCGLTTVKNLLAAGLKEIVCYDDGIAIGGNWVFDERSGRGSVYDATHLISSKRLSEFEDYPMPSEYPDFPSHRLVRAYFEDYAAQFGLMRFIRLESRVEAANLLDNGTWSVVVSDPKGTREETFDDLIVCSGHHRDPFVPDVAGHFSGQTLHARDYRRAAPFQGQRVLVVGGGNSACDIAVDMVGWRRTPASACGADIISFRRSCWVAPVTYCITGFVDWACRSHGPAVWPTPG